MADKAPDSVALKKAENNWYLLQRANTPRRQVWLRDLYKGNDYFEDIQMTTQELKDLQDAGMPTFTTNRMTPVLEIMKYFITANRPRWQATGWTGDDSQMSEIFDGLFEYTFHLSDGDMQIGQIVLNTLTKSLGWFNIYADTMADRGMGETMFNSIAPDTVYVDPTCRDLMFRDAAFIIVAKNVTKQWLKNYLPQYEAEIEKATGTPLTTGSADSSNPSRDEEVSEDAVSVNAGLQEDVIPFIETYKKKKVLFYNLFIHEIPSADEMSSVEQQAKVELEELQIELAVQFEEATKKFSEQLEAGEIIESRMQFELQKLERVHQMEYQQKQQYFESTFKQMQSNVVNKSIRKDEYDELIKSGSIVEEDIMQKIPYWEDRVFKEVSVGNDTLLYDEDTDFIHYPTIPLPFMFNGGPYPTSAAKPMIGKQQQINKAGQITIHHAILSSNSPWLIQAGTLTNEEDWDMNVSMPGGRLEYEYAGPDSMPVRQKPEPLNNAFFQIAENGKAELEYTAGVPSSLMGLADNPSETFRGKMANDEFSTRRLKAWIKTVFEPVLTHVGNVFLDVSQHVYKIHKVFRIVNEEGFKEYEMNVPIFNDIGEKIGKMFDYETLKFDIRVVSSSTLPTNKEAEEGRWIELQKEGITDDIETIKHIGDISDKEGLIKRKSIYSQLSGRVEQLENELKKTTGDLQTAQREVVSARIKNKVLTGGMESHKDVIETEGQQKNLQKQMKNEFDLFRKELALLKKEVAMNSKTETKSDKKE